MLILIAGLFCLSLAGPLVVLRWGRRGFLPIAAVVSIGTLWVAARGPAVLEGDVRTEVFGWVPSIAMDLAFSMGALQWVLAMIVLGIGAVVLAYCTWYFYDDSEGVPRFAGVLIAFVAAMLGLVLSDNLLLTYVFWELTTVLSFLLIGHDPAKRSSRQAAIQALLVTTFGGLAMLVGAIVLGQQAGTMRISEILSDPPAGLAVTIAVHLLLVGAISKSALLPFHFWLPAAMAAPTPVSAYLHAASMVKAGVFLIALLAPAFADVPGWRAVLLVLGLATMLVGGVRAMLQHDLKLLLAYGTVSQLGFMITVLGVGTRSATLAGLSLLLAHALFKACLFLVVGLIDRTTGTRDLRRLTGLRRRMPVVAVAAGIAAASMAGLPPLIGYVAKESVFVALVDVAKDGDGTGLSSLAGVLVLLGVVVGSVLTVAYSARFLWGAFADREVEEEPTVRDVSWGFAAGPVLLAGLTVILGFFGHQLTELLGLQSDLFPAGLHEAELSLWHGVGLPLGATLIALILGAVLFVFRTPVHRWQASWHHEVSLERLYRWVVRALERTAVEVTGLVQRGSAAAYLGLIMLVVVVVPGSVLFRVREDLHVVAWQTPSQVAVGLVTAVAAVMAARSRRRLRAVLLAGATGYGTAILFIMHGAPDLALTQVLVETLTVVVVVLALRRLPEYFTDRPLSRRRYLRVALGAGVAVVVAGFLLVATSARTAAPVSATLPELAVEIGGGKNIVNVILVDVRAWDTLGEIAVLVAAATGVASLIFHTIIVLSVYLLLAGHNAPGGGFAAGMVAGLALVLRYLAGGRYELDEAAPVDAGKLIGGGLAVAALAAIVPLFLGGAVLESAIVDLHIPLLGDLHLVTSTFFDVGVYLVVIGLVLDLLRALGSQIDRHILRDRRAAEAAEAEAAEAEVARG